MDLRYLNTDYTGKPTILTDNNMDVTRQNEFNSALYTLEWKSQLSESFVPAGTSTSMTLNKRLITINLGTIISSMYRGSTHIFM